MAGLGKCRQQRRDGGGRTDLLEDIKVGKLQERLFGAKGVLNSRSLGCKLPPGVLVEELVSMRGNGGQRGATQSTRDGGRGHVRQSAM